MIAAAGPSSAATLSLASGGAGVSAAPISAAKTSAAADQRATATYSGISSDSGTPTLPL